MRPDGRTRGNKSTSAGRGATAELRETAEASAPTQPAWGEAGTVDMAANLDRPAPRFTAGGDIPYFRKKQIDLKRDEPVTLSLSFTGRKAYYEFDLRAIVLAYGRTEEIVIRPDGGPFRLTGEAARYRS
ncbi:hypothetical protein [Nonomuraea wenchangensis]|nr:hypothetical protein [Nonomuraea wenchangensis]